MAIRYTNTYLDSLAFYTVHNLRSFPLLTIIVLAAGLVAWTSLPGNAVGFGRVLAFGIMTSIFFVVMLTIQLLFNSFWSAVNRNRNFLTEHKVELTEESFIQSTELTRSETKWQGVFAVRRGLNRLFVFTGPTGAHVIPARAFQQGAEFDAFANQAMERWQNSRKR